jgi:hypothetical protein
MYCSTGSYIRGRYGGVGTGQYKNEIIMIQETNISTYQYPSTFDELIYDSNIHPEMYKHLQIIFSSKKEDESWGIGQRYLVVNYNGYGVYILDNLDYRDGKIYMTLTNQYTMETEKMSLDINDKHPKHYFIKWEDIKGLAYDEQTKDKSDNELLELDED